MASNANEDGRTRDDARNKGEAMVPDTGRFAEEWIRAWNSHDLDKILDHYSDDFEITSPMIRTVLGVESGTLRGKKSIRKYWQAALQKVPDLKFELIDAAICTGSIALSYRSVMNKRAIEVMFFDEAGKVVRAVAHYTEAAGTRKG